jgi:C-terminal processing protease CtpA/Prc
LTVTEVAPGSAAASAGLRAQDRIISIDGQPMTGQRRLMAVLGGIYGERIPVVIDRGGRQFTVQLTMDSAGERPWLGVYLQDNQENERGARITHIYPAGPAARAGLRTGDVIVGVNDQEIQASYDLIAAIDALQPQSKVKLKVLRGERELDAVATLATRDSFVFHSNQYGDRGQGNEGRQGFEGRDRGYSDDPFANLPPYAMQMEHDRRNAEQHERIEAEIRKLAEEVRMLREALQRR